MLQQKIISLQELTRFGNVSTLNEQAKTLVKEQDNSWNLAANNYFGLTRAKYKTFEFGHFKIIAQHNPERIRSSAAKTDAKTIEERPCFLCLENLPPEQKGILFQKDYIILTNPFPIFPQHLTIPGLKHVPQRILNHFTEMLDLSRELTNFTVFYNGQQTGATAPDHFHFQAGTKGIMPVEQEFNLLVKNQAEILLQTDNTKVIAVENYLRPFIGIISNNKKAIRQQFETIFQILQTKNDEEPKLNVLCNFENENWRVIIFPREKQRPCHFYLEDDSKIVVGPAAVEFGGLLILPRKEDFDKITHKEIEEIYGEVAVNKHLFQNLCNTLKLNL